MKGDQCFDNGCAGCDDCVDDEAMLREVEQLQGEAQRQAEAVQVVGDKLARQ
jgi:hypothetical protein